MAKEKKERRGGWPKRDRVELMVRLDRNLGYELEKMKVRSGLRSKNLVIEVVLASIVDALNAAEGLAMQGRHHYADRIEGLGRDLLGRLVAGKVVGRAVVEAYLKYKNDQEQELFRLRAEAAASRAIK